MRKRWIATLLAVCMIAALAPAESIAAASVDPAGCRHEWYVSGTSDPGCTYDGQTIYKCRLCGATKTEKGRSALGHQWEAWVVTKEPTCSAKGERTRICHRCGKTDKDSLRKTGHVYGDWVVTAEPQDVPGVQKPGTREQACIHCGRTQSETFYPVGTQVRKGEHDLATVKAFQEALNEAGYKVGEADGVFDKTTEDGVKKFQKAADCKQDGIFWPCMWALLGIDPPEGVPAPGQEEGPAGGSESGGPAVSPATASGAHLSLHVTLLNPKSAYQLSDEVSFGVFLENDGTAELTAGEAACTKNGDPLPYVITYADPSDTKIAASDYLHKDYKYTIGTADLLYTQLSFEFSGSAIDPVGDPVYAEPVTITVDLDPSLPHSFEKPTVQVTEFSHPLDGSAYGYGETVIFEITIDNDTPWSFTPVNLYNSQSDTTYKDVVYGLSLLPKDKPTFYAYHFVTVSDGEAGELEAKTWADLIDPAGDPDTVFGNDVKVKTKDFTLPTLKVTIPDPPDPEGWMMDDVIPIELTVENPTQWTYYNMDLFDSLSDYPPYQVTNKFTVADSSTYTFKTGHVVTPLEVNMGTIVNVAHADLTDPMGQPHTIYAEDIPLTLIPFSMPDLFIVEDSFPLDGAYDLDENIVFHVYTENNTGYVFSSVGFYNGLENPPSHFYGSAPTMDATPVNMYIVHKVTPEDQAAGHVTDTAWMVFLDPAGIEHTVYAEDLTVKVKKLPETTVAVPTQKAEASPAPDCCVRTMTAHADGLPVWEIAPCEEHGELLARTFEALKAAGSDPDALLSAETEAAMLWYDAIDALYAEWIAADPSAEAAAKEDREAFYAEAAALLQLLTLGKQSSDPAVAETVFDLLAEKCTDLCYAVRTAPGARADTVRAGLAEAERAGSGCGVRYEFAGGRLVQTTCACEEHAAIASQAMEMLLSAGPAERAAVLNRIRTVWQIAFNQVCSALTGTGSASIMESVGRELAAFGRAQEARKAALSALYPDDPETVSELLAQQMMLRVLRFCALEEEFGF